MSREIETLEEYPIDINDSLDCFFYILELAPQLEHWKDGELIDNLHHMGFTSWKIILTTALKRWHGIVGESINVDYLKCTNYTNALDQVFHVRLLVRVEKIEDVKFIGAITNHIFPLEFLGLPNIESQVKYIKKYDGAKPETDFFAIENYMVENSQNELK